MLQPRDVEEVSSTRYAIGMLRLQPSGPFAQAVGAVKSRKLTTAMGIAPSNNRCIFRRRDGWRLVARTMGARLRGWRLGWHALGEA
jgi:hypothetical protein